MTTTMIQQGIVLLLIFNISSSCAQNFILPKKKRTSTLELIGQETGTMIEQCSDITLEVMNLQKDSMSMMHELLDPQPKSFCADADQDQLSDYLEEIKKINHLLDQATTALNDAQTKIKKLRCLPKKKS